MSVIVFFADVFLLGNRFHHVSLSFCVPHGANVTVVLPMLISQTDADNPKWTYTMEDGKCTNSLALQVNMEENAVLVLLRTF